MKILFYTKDSCLRASPRHGGAGSFFKFFDHRSATGAPRRGWRHSSYQMDRVIIISASYLNNTIFMGNAQSQSFRSGGFTPAAVAPRYDKTRTGAPSSSLSAGAVWGDRHCPLLHRTSILNFISKEKEFNRAIR